MRCSNYLHVCHEISLMIEWYEKWIECSVEEQQVYHCIEHALRIWWGKTQVASSARKLGNYSFKISGKQFQLENNLNPLEFSITSHLIQYMKHGVLISGRSSYYLRRCDFKAGQLCQSFGTNDWLWLIYILCM